MEKYSLNNIMAHINRTDVQGKMVRSQDVSFLFTEKHYIFHHYLEVTSVMFFKDLIHITYAFSN